MAAPVVPSARLALQNVIGGITGDVVDAYGSFKDTQAKQDQAKMAALKEVEVKGVKLVAGRFKGRQKVIGTLKNAGDRTIKGIKVTLSYFDAEGRLVDVDTSWLSSIAFLKPGEQANFSTNRGFDRKTGAPARRVSVKVTALSLVDADRK